LPKKDNPVGNSEKINQPSIIIENEKKFDVKLTNSHKIQENQNNIETRIYTDNYSNASNHKYSNDKIKIIQNAFRKFRSNKLYLDEKNKKIYLEIQNNIIDKDNVENNNHYIRKSLKDNNAFDFNNYSSLDFLDKDDSKGNYLPI